MLGWAKNNPTQHPLHEQWVGILIHAYCSRSEQREEEDEGYLACKWSNQGG
jgi:hypothetical protein